MKKPTIKEINTMLDYSASKLLKVGSSEQSCPYCKVIDGNDCNCLKSLLP